MSRGGQGGGRQQGQGQGGDAGEAGGVVGPRSIPQVECLGGLVAADDEGILLATYEVFLSLRNDLEFIILMAINT